MKKETFLRIISSMGGVALFSSMVSIAFAAPDMTGSITGPTIVAPNSTVTFTGTITNAGTEMNITNSYRDVKVGGMDLQNNPAVEIESALPYTYISLGSSGITPDVPSFDDLLTFNVTNPIAPSKTWGKYISNSGSTALDRLAISGNRMYTTEQQGYVHVYDLNNPAAPQEHGTVYLSQNDFPASFGDVYAEHLYDIAAYGNYAYVRRGNGVGIINASNPDIPVSSQNTMLCVRSDLGVLYSCPNNLSTPMLQSGIYYWPIANLFVSGAYLYVTFYDGWLIYSGMPPISWDPPGIAIFSLADPMHPTLVGTDVNWTQYSVDNGNGTWSGYHVSPQPAGSVYPNLSPSAISNGRLYSTLGEVMISNINDGYTHITNVTNPASPFQEARASINPALPSGMSTYSNQIAGNYLYVGTSRGLSVLDVANPASPVLKSFDLGYSTLGIYDLSLPSNYYIHALGSSGLDELAILEPHTFTRFCIDNPSCAQSTTGRLGGSDFDAGRLGGGASRTFTANWTAPATSGLSHTVYYCTDTYSTTVPPYDGVAETNEANNCASASFTVALPPTVTTQAATNVFSGSGEMKAFVNSNGGGAITGWFRYDPVSSNLNCAADSGGTRAPVGSGSNFGAVGSTYYGNNVSSLTPATRYYYCAIASTPAGMSYGSILFFDTLPATRTVTPSAGSGGTLSPSTAQTVTYNNTIAFTVTPSAGYSIGSVTGCGGSLAGSTYTTGPITASCTVSATFTLLTGCANGRDALGNPLTLLSVDRTAAELNGKYRVTKFGGNYCFGNTSSSRYLIPLNTLAEFLSFWNNIGAGSNLPGLYRIP